MTGGFALTRWAARCRNPRSQGCLGQTAVRVPGIPRGGAGESEAPNESDYGRGLRPRVMGNPEADIRRVMLGLTADTLATAVIIVWGLTYLMAAVLAPALIGNLPTALSAAGMVIIGLLLLWSVYSGSRPLAGFLALVQIGSMVGSWVGAIRWAVPYDPGLAAVSMAAMDFLVAVALVSKTVEVIDIGPAPVPEE